MPKGLIMVIVVVDMNTMAEGSSACLSTRTGTSSDPGARHRPSHRGGGVVVLPRGRCRLVGLKLLPLDKSARASVWRVLVPQVTLREVSGPSKHHNADNPSGSPNLSYTAQLSADDEMDPSPPSATP